MDVYNIGDTVKIATLDAPLARSASEFASRLTMRMWQASGTERSRTALFSMGCSGIGWPGKGWRMTGCTIG